MKNRIKESLDRVAPDDAARDRMYANIMEKAKTAKSQKPAARNTVMRAMKIALPAAACVCLAVIALYRQPWVREDYKSSEPMVGGLNEEYSDILDGGSAELTGSIHISVVLPDGAENAEYQYSAYGTEVTFDLGGQKYLLRTGTDRDYALGDCSDDLAKRIVASDGAVLRDDAGKTAIIFWYDGGAYYLLSSESASDAEITAVCASIRVSTAEE